MRKLVLIVAMLGLCLTTLKSQEALDLQEAVLIMQSKNHKILALQKQKEAQYHAQRQTLALRLPTIGITAQGMHINKDLAVDFNEQRNKAAYLLQLPNPAILGDWSAVLQEQNFASVDVNVFYPIFTGGKINAGIKAAKVQTSIKDKEIEKENNAMMSTLVQRYFQLQLAQQAVKVRQTALEATEAHFYNASKLEANGMIANVEKMQAEAAVSDAKRHLMAAQKDADLAKTALSGLLGGYTVGDSLSTKLFVSIKIKDLNYYTQKAVSDYPDIAKLELQEELARQNVKATWSGYLPTIALFGGKHLYTKNMPLEDDLDWFAGIGLNYTLFSGMKRHQKLKEAKATKESVRLFREQAEQDIATLVKRYYQEMEKQREIANALDKDLAFAQELLRVRQKAFAEGFAKSTDVVDATLYVSSIQLKQLKALCDYDMYLAQLLELCGESHAYSEYIVN